MVTGPAWNLCERLDERRSNAQQSLVMETSQRLLIVGASARAAAHSAVRAGLQPVCADMFLDEDLQAVAQVLPLDDYPRGLPSVARIAPHCPWMYTGALENHPDIVARISADRALLGNPPDVVRRVRNPVHVRNVLLDNDFPSLRLRSKQDVPEPDGQWMLRSRHGSGGAGIHIWDSGTAKQTHLKAGDYFQQRVDGSPISALFLSTPAKTWLAGMTRQFIGVESVGAPAFAYCGSVGPIKVAETIQTSIHRAGQVLANKCGLRGLFGCDFLLDDRVAWLTEVNPRYTASVEILEYAFDVPLLQWHCRSFTSAGRKFEFRTSDNDRQTAMTRIVRQENGQITGKMILFAIRDIVITSMMQLSARNRSQAVPYIADVPAAGSLIKCGRPICTVLAAGHNMDDCQARLQQRVDEVLSYVYGCPFVPFGHGKSAEFG